ncbi:hypothetical protein FH972_017645 [Carpinus fangiana]|uniref:Uncharacterized protein n=1 Tax=Carpinus fangiana TaxID=176857 RepID=A0A5N6RMJ0_9ROSI|nr:hypothetical protein FH972_017645 [Carpinus fangiana]
MAYQAAMKGENLHKGPWLEEEDERLTSFVSLVGERRWDSLARASGLQRSGKSCRLRWLNYLRPNLKHGDISIEEERIILQLQELWGNKWARIARRLPGRTDNKIKNYWRTHLRKKAQAQQGNFHYRLNNIADQEYLFFQKGEMGALKYNCGNIKGSVEEFCSSKNESLDDLGLSNPGLTSSPYETRLISDWISELSNDHQSEMKHHEGCNSVESCLCYPTWIPDDSINVWNHSSSLWEMD